MCKYTKYAKHENILNMQYKWILKYVKYTLYSKNVKYATYAKYEDMQTYEQILMLNMKIDETCEIYKIWKYTKIH